MSGQQPYRFTDYAVEEFLIADGGAAPAAGHAFLVVDEHQIDVAAVVQLLAAMFAEGQNNTASRFARSGVRLAKTSADCPQGRRESHFERGIRDSGNVLGNL